MNMQFYMEKLSSSEEFKSFMKENTDAYLCSGFFVIDKSGDDNKQHFDYYIPNSKKMFSFQLEGGVKMVPIEILNEKIPEKISKLEFDFDNMELMIQKEMEKQNIKNKIQKMMFSLQNFNEKDFLVCTVFISMLSMLKVNIDLSNEKITEFKKKSFFDIMKIGKGE